MYDVIIIGAGPAGISAALWCSELQLDTLVLEQKAEIGGQLLSVHNEIRNHLGITARNGRELRDQFAAHVQDADFDLWNGAEIERIDLKTRRLTLRSGEDLRAITIILATGVRRRQLGIPGEKEFVGRGIIESAARDRDLYKGLDVCVVGGGDAAAENALYLAEVCPTVTMVHRGKRLRARDEFSERIKADHRITLFTESRLERIMGGERVEAVEIKRDEGLKPFQTAVQAVLIRIGVEPNSELFRDQLTVDDRGYILANNNHETSVENVFAIGDVSNPLAPTISSAIGTGATAAKVISSRLQNR